MDIQKNKSGNYVVINNQKHFLNENEMLLVENFWHIIDGEIEGKFANTKEDIFNEIKNGKYIVKTGQTPNGEVKALYKNENLIGALIGERYVDASVKGLTEACSNLFNL